MSAREMPHSLTAEKSVLGAIFVRPDRFSAVNVKPAHFFDARTRAVWEAFAECVGNGTAIDIATVENALQRAGRLDAIGGVSFLADVAITMPTADNVEHYARIVRDHAKTREVILAAAEVVAAGYSGEAHGDELLARLMRAARGIRPANRREAISARALAERRTRELVACSERKARGENPARVPTAIPQLDGRLGGLPRGNHTGLVAMPGYGKTATLMHFAFNAPCPSLTFSFEELARDQTDRFLSAAANIPGVAIAAGHLTGKEMARIIDAADRMPTDRYFVDARGMSDDDVTRVARQVVPELGIGLVQVDYLNRVKLSASAKLRTDERMRQALAAFDDACGELDVAWVTAAQVNRDPGKQNRMPHLNDARECGALEEFSKLGIVVFRPRFGTDTDNEIWIYIDKANIGGRICCKCDWHGPTMKITPRQGKAGEGEIEF